MRDFAPVTMLSTPVDFFVDNMKCHKINIPRHSRGFYIYGLIRPLLTSCA